MGERKLERISVVDHRFFFYAYPLKGFSLRFVSGPEMTKGIKHGSWLDTWETIDGKRHFGFGPQKNVVFATKEAAIDAKKELEKAVDIITDIEE
jgi:hypothetical protein